MGRLSQVSKDSRHRKASKECSPKVRPFFKNLFVYRVFLRFESQLSTKGNRQIPERISRWQRCSAAIGPDQLPSRVLPSRNSLSAINERTFGKRSKGSGLRIKQGKKKAPKEPSPRASDKWPRSQERKVKRQRCALQKPRVTP